MTIINQTNSCYRPDAIDGVNRLYGVYVGFVKGNKDVQMMGRLQVCIPDLGGDPNDATTWHVVSYASPFAGATDIETTTAGTAMANTQLAYGWWAVPPDINNQVLVCFANGDPGHGYWFACIFQQFMNHMVPGIAAGQSTTAADMQNGIPPVCEYNKRDPTQSANYWNPQRPTFTPLKKGFDNQGLGKDAERGPGTTSARREAPSLVFGFNSPRGNTIHIDDNPQNEFIRLRTRSGAQILIHETTGYIYMISREGNSWMEISDIGIDMYSKRSISLRAEENINMHADSCVIMHGVGAVHTTGGNISRSSKGQINDISCGEQARHSPRIKDNSKQSSGTNGQSKGSAGVGQNGASPAAAAAGNGQASKGTPLTQAQMQADAGSGYFGTNQQCVSLSKDLGTDQNGNALGPASGWMAGSQITGDNWQQYQGQAVATMNDDGQYSSVGGVSGNATHTGILQGWNDSTNEPILLNQWSGSGGARISSSPTKYGSYYTIAQ